LDVISLVQCRSLQELEVFLQLPRATKELGSQASCPQNACPVDARGAEVLPTLPQPRLSLCV